MDEFCTFFCLHKRAKAGSRVPGSVIGKFGHPSIGRNVFLVMID